MKNPFSKSVVTSVVARLFAAQIDTQVNERLSRQYAAALAVRALDDASDRLLSRGRAADTYPRDRRGYDRDEVLQDVLDAWRQNPLARRIVELTSQYVVGGGLGVECKHERTHRFLRRWWEHRLNRMSMRAFDLCDELSRTGNLFVVISTDAAGMSYIRALPTQDILEIETAANDLEQETVIWEKAPAGEGFEGQSGPGGLIGRAWQAYNPATDANGAANGAAAGAAPDEGQAFAPVVVHYSVNRPLGAKWGESDLAPLVRWLGRYSAWLEDRARLNRYRQAFLYVVKAQYTSQAERLQRQAELNANPPNPGSILVADASEEWSVLSPDLASFEAAEDGLALKKMIAVGSGNPLHFLAEPESATRTTAESAGGPTFRHYEQRQQFFLWLMQDLARIVVRRRAAVDPHVRPNAEILVKGTDISARDNAALADASRSVIEAFSELRQRGLIDDSELLRLAYRFAGEVVDVESMLKRGKEQKSATEPTENTEKGRSLSVPKVEIVTTRTRRHQDLCRSARK